MTNFKNIIEYFNKKKYKINSFNAFFNNIELPNTRELNGVKIFFIEEELKLEIKSNFESKYILIELLLRILENEYSGNKILLFKDKKKENNAEELVRLNDFEAINSINSWLKIDEIIETEEEIKFEIFFDSIENFKEELNYVYFLEIEGFHKLYFLWKQLDEYQNLEKTHP